ncbi:hypothetical protein VMCG_06109 [Cytospora schulzeri]|uniref:2EXR domain-containing protein n=1 Tax=Cytospora schulzeri TaxID=448051 RepID=A0A423WGF7_9PEZI|nr:hypothetical protein VMCG_06109 [Valsa malicola]
MSDDQDSDEHPYSDSDHDDESQDSSSDEATGNGLFDLEASEDDSEAAYEGQNGFDDDDDGDYLDSFPKFMQLPAELREMVWKQFCPDLAAGPRVFELCLIGSARPKLIIPGGVLETQTAPMRALLAICRETRAMGLTSSPHTFSLSGGELIRYHEEKDVIHVVMSPGGFDARLALGIQGLFGSPHNIAFSYNFPEDCLVDTCYLLPDVRRIFILVEHVDLHDVPVKDYAWTVSENIHRYHSETDEDGEAGLVNTVKTLICWPDLDKHRDFALQNVDYGAAGGSPLGDTIWACRHYLANPESISEELPQEYLTDEMREEAVSRLQKIEVWPMIQFSGESGLQMFKDMKAWDRPWDEWDSGSSASDDTEDEYDSEGIDDGSIHDHLSTDDEDDLPRQLLADNSSDQGNMGHLLDSSSEVNNDLAAAQFSGDDNDENDNQAGNSDASGSDDDEAGPRSRASRPKRRVVESESEDESATETEEPRPTAKRRGRVVLADSEDEGDEEEDNAGPRPAQGRGRRARAVPSDSEDEDDDDNDIPKPSRTTKNRRARALPAEGDDDDDDEGNPREGVADPQKASSSDEEEDSSEESSSDEEDDTPAPPKRMSLAQRLRMEAQRARSGHRGGEGSDADGNEYAAASDDDEGVGDGDGDGMEQQEYSSDDGESEEDF